MTTDNFCFYLQNRIIQTSQTGGQRYGDTACDEDNFCTSLVDFKVLVSILFAVHLKH
jgi:hypothetical protein